MRTPVPKEYLSPKSDIGNYNYSSQQSGCSYSHPHSQPHAVRNAGGNVYCYDANGNMTSRAGSSITWFSDNTVKKITQGSATSEFWYTPDGERYRQDAIYSTGSEKTFYIGGVMEKVIVTNATTTTTAFRHRIIAGSNSIVHTRWSTGAEQTYYVTSDSLGTSSAITDRLGSIVVTESFDAFGKRRGTNWTGTPTGTDMQAIANATRDGFTGHEQLDNVGLIHMNGRVQDPALGRFISADPIIQAPEASQSMNRYSYVWNNPLSLRDPSGFMAGGGPDCGAGGVSKASDCPSFDDLRSRIRIENMIQSYWQDTLAQLNSGLFINRLREMTSTSVFSPGRPQYPGEVNFFPAEWNTIPRRATSFDSQDEVDVSASASGIHADFSKVPGPSGEVIATDDQKAFARDLARGIRVTSNEIAASVFRNGAVVYRRGTNNDARCLVTGNFCLHTHPKQDAPQGSMITAMNMSQSHRLGFGTDDWMLVQRGMPNFMLNYRRELWVLEFRSFGFFGVYVPSLVDPSVPYIGK